MALACEDKALLGGLLLELLLFLHIVICFVLLLVFFVSGFVVLVCGVFEFLLWLAKRFCAVWLLLAFEERVLDGFFNRLQRFLAFEWPLFESDLLWVEHVLVMVFFFLFFLLCCEFGELVSNVFAGFLFYFGHGLLVFLLFLLFFNCFFLSLELDFLFL